jgi:hypothetical protein
LLCRGLLVGEIFSIFFLLCSVSEAACLFAKDGNTKKSLDLLEKVLEKDMEKKIG